MGASSRKQVALVAALLLLCAAAWPALAVHDVIGPECAEQGSACSDERRCCGAMECSTLEPGPSPWIFYHRAQGRCRAATTLSGGCTEGGGGDGEQFHASFFLRDRYMSLLQSRSTCAAGLGVCEDLFGGPAPELENGIEDVVWSMTWSENTAIAVYDEASCGGNSMLAYSAGPYKLVLDDGPTLSQGFLAGGVPDLSRVCKRDRCGGVTSAHSAAATTVVVVLVGGGNASSSCDCTEAWRPSVRSYRLHRRPPTDAQTTRNAR